MSTKRAKPKSKKKSAPRKWSMEISSNVKQTELRKRSRGNTTIAVGAQLLSVIAKLSGPATLGVIADAAGLTPSSTYRYLRGLVETGFVEQDPISARYDLGGEALHVGLAALGRTDACRRALSVLPELTSKTELVAVLSVWGSHGPTTLLSEHGSYISSIRIHEGTVLPLLSTAAGKVFLTYMPTHLTDPLVELEKNTWKAANPGEETITQEKIMRFKAEVHHQGLALSIGRRNQTHANLAAPVFDHLGRLCLVISLLGRRGTFDWSPEGVPATELKRVTMALSDRLGASREEAQAKSS